MEIIMGKIAVLIPCYNESKTIKKVIEDYRQALPEAKIYVYDNNYTNGIDNIVRVAGAKVWTCDLEFLFIQPAVRKKF